MHKKSMSKILKEAFLSSPFSSKRNIQRLRTLKKQSLKKKYEKALEKKIPIKKNTILYESFWGRGMIDNPYALFLYLLDDEKYQHVWVLNDLNYYPCIKKFEKYNNVSFVEYNSQEYFEYLVSAEYLINNVTFESYFMKQEGQVYINTWHGTPIKKMGFDVEGDLDKTNNIYQNFLSADYLLSANQITTDMYLHSFHLNEKYQGEIVEGYYPRNDLLFTTKKENLLLDLKEADVEIDPNKKIILYAPTWREDNKGLVKNNIDEIISFEKELKRNLESLDRYEILLKPHQFVYENLKGNDEFIGKLIPSYIDTNQLLSIVDVLITDYSSIFIDYMCTKKPIIFYSPDIDLYQNERGLNITVDQLPGPTYNKVEDVVGYLLKIEKDNELNEQYLKLYELLCQKNAESSKMIVNKVFK